MSNDGYGSTPEGRRDGGDEQGRLGDAPRYGEYADGGSRGHDPQGGQGYGQQGYEQQGYGQEQRQEGYGTGASADRPYRDERTGDGVGAGQTQQYGSQPGGSNVQGGYGGQYGGQNVHMQGGYGAPRPSAALAITALVLGVLSLLGLLVAVGGLLGIVAIVVGIVALVQIRKGRARGKGMAIAGIVTGVLALIGVILLTLVIGTAVKDSGVGDCLQKSSQAEQQQCLNEINKTKSGG